MNPRNALLFVGIFCLLGLGVLLLMFAGSKSKTATNVPPPTAQTKSTFFPLFGNAFTPTQTATTTQENTHPTSSGNTAGTSSQPASTVSTKAVVKPATAEQVTQKPVLNTQNIPIPTKDSSLKGTLKFGYGGGLSGGYYDSSGNLIRVPEQEYISIQALQTNTESVPISGLKLHSIITDAQAIIGQGSYLPIPGAVNPQQDIYLKPGETAYIITGHSPIGTSFQVNICAGYFSQHQTFYPTLYTQCPAINKEPLPPPPNNINDKCIDRINYSQSCQTFAQGELSLTPECNAFLVKVTTYNYCITAHKNDTGFYKPEWRVYLNLSTALWKNQRETIELLDRAGKPIDTYTY